MAAREPRATEADTAAVAPRSTPPVGLRPFSRGDFARLIAWIPNEVAMLQWAGPIFAWPLTEGQLERYLAPARPWPISPPPQRLIWTALDAANGQAVGHVELNSIDLAHRSTTLSRVLVGPAFRGRGYGRAMIAQVLPIAFDDLGLHRVDLVAFEYNEPALRCYRSLGFTREGVLRDVRFMDGSFVNSVVMSLLEDERRTPAGR
jgi:RimJ/RimL family protein N-acetyltransferase